MNKKIVFTIAAFVLLTTSSMAQGKYFTKSGKIEFFSVAPLENIEAKNKSVTAVLDTKSGAFQFAILMKAFEFEKALMQEHFNENFVESDKYPRSEFRGTIVNNADINYNKPGTYTTRVKGKLTIHGVTRDVETNGTLNVEKDNIKAASVFNVSLSDYNISIPALVKDKVAKTIKITVDCKLEPLKE